MSVNTDKYRIPRLDRFFIANQEVKSKTINKITTSRISIVAHLGSGAKGDGTT